MKAQLAFYKHKGTWVDKAIRFWTRSKYSHCEIVIGDGELLEWYSSSPRDGGVRKLVRPVDTDRWDLVPIDVDEERLLTLFDRYEGRGYDYLGIFLNELFPFGIEDHSKYYCSEFCAEVLHLEDVHISPKRLYGIIEERNNA